MLAIIRLRSPLQLLSLSPEQFEDEGLSRSQDKKMKDLLRSLWSDDSGQDVAEYAVMLAVILVIVVGTLKLIGGQSNNVFSEVASSIG
jgi:Flp pilus assembly pilin Flp